MSLYKFVLKNLLKNRFKTALVAFSVFLSFFILGFVFTLGDWLSGRLASGRYKERMVVESKYTLPLNWSIFEQLRNVNGVDPDTVTGNTVLAGYLQSPDKKFLQRAVNGENFLRMEERYLSFVKEDTEAWIKDRRGALVGRSLADKFGFKKGDTISLKSSLRQTKDGAPWIFNIHGIFDATDSGVKTKFMVFHSEYLIEGVGNFQDVDWYELNIKEGFDPNSVAKTIDEGFKTSRLATSSQVLAAITNTISSQAGDFYLLAKIIISASFFTLFLVVGSSVIRAIKERSLDIAVLKTLGFKTSKISQLIFNEVLTLVLFGGLPALVLLGLVETIPYVKHNFAGLVVSWQVIISIFFIMLLFALVITIYPVYMIRKTSIASALRKG
jgi:putative ABC transport system permease protein